MKIGTKSVLFGAHAFYLHPWFVAWAWWKLYGFPWDPRLWVAFFVHDLGYWGKPNMDGDEGEEHPYLGARIMYKLFDRTRGWLPDARWFSFCLFHSRFLAKRHNTPPSRLCIADKLAIALTPWWLYLPMVIATGEIREYVRLASDRRPDERSGLIETEVMLAATEAPLLRWGLYRMWYRDLEKYMREWVEEHRDGREDTWTPDTREARGDSGVWQ